MCRHMIVIGTEPVERPELAEGDHVLVVAPALNSRLRRWLSDEDGARAAAAQRLERTLAAFRGDGVDADGVVGDADPRQALDDALRRFGADRVSVAPDLAA